MTHNSSYNKRLENKRCARDTSSCWIFQFLRLCSVSSLLFLGTAHAESCRNELFADAVQTHSNTGAVNFGFNAFVSNNTDSILQTPAVQRNGGLTVATCGQDDCVATGDGLPSLVLEDFQTGPAGQNAQVSYQGNETLGDDGQRNFGSVNVGSEGVLAFVGGAVEPVYTIESLSLGFRGELKVSSGTYWIRTLNLGSRSQIDLSPF